MVGSWGNMFILIDWLFIGHQVLTSRFQESVGLIFNSHWRKDCKMETQLSGLRGLAWSGVDMLLLFSL